MNKYLKSVLLSNYGAVISMGLFTPIFALFVVELGGGAFQVGAAAASYYFLAGVCMFSIRRWLDSPRMLPKIYCLGYVLGGLAALSFIFVSELWQLFLVQTLHALATACRVPAQRALYAEHEDKGKEGSEWSIMEGGDFMILGVAALAGGAVVATISFDIIFGLMALLQFGAAIMATRLIRASSTT